MLLTKQNYKKYLKGISVVEVSGESCANCFTLLPILNRLLSTRSDCTLHHIEVTEQTMDLVELFSIESVPTILVFKDDVIHAKCKGYQPEEILSLWLDAKLEELKD